ncbi:MAG TPA: hypothetical protein VM598_02440 [Bdellovibrionota bacterium]|nr:hypothetical protein [Bdellovibrionota bacterium]
MRRELEDLALLLGAGLLVAVVWLAFLGWLPSRLISQHDGIVFDFPLLREALEVRGRIGDLSYRPQWLGGVSPDRSFGVPWIFRFALGLGLPIHHAANIMVLGLQTAFAFLGIRLAESLAFLAGARPRAGLPARALSWAPQAVVFAFAPVLAYKLTYGHWMMPLGTLVFLSIAAVLAASLAGRASWVLALVSVGLVAACCQVIHQQANLFGWIFGLPILLGILLLGKKDRGRAVLVCAAVLVAGLALAAGEIRAFLSAQGAGDLARSEGAGQDAFSYLKGTALDWASSLTWGQELIASGRSAGQLHETSFAIGPALLPALFLPWRRLRPLAIGLGISLFLSVAYSTGLEPVSSALLAAIPILGKFRVPMRAALPIALFVPVLAVVSMLLRSQEPKSNARVAAALAIATGLACILGGWGREAIFLLLLGPVYARFPSRAWLAVLAAGSLLAFHQRAIPPRAHGDTLDKLEAARTILRKAAPEAGEPLVRTEVDLGPSLLRNNVGAFLGLSTLNGYFPPPDRFLRLLTALARAEYHPQIINVGPELTGPAMPVLRQLYNFRYRVSAPGGKLAIDRIRATPPGPAWFPAGLAVVPDYGAAATLLWRSLESGHGVAETAPIIEGDRALPAVPELDPKCRQARVESVKSERHGQVTIVRYTSPARCVLTVAMNYNASLSAQFDDPAEPGRVFPIYGALAGIVVRPGSSSLRIESRR